MKNILVLFLTILASAACGQKKINKKPENPEKANTMEKTTATKMQVEIWSDIMCPFCYIGKRHYEAALNAFADRNDVEIVWKSFQLDPDIPAVASKPENVYEYLAKRKGMSYDQSVRMHQNVAEMAKKAGLEYNFDKTIIANSFDAHKVIQLAKTKGLGDAIEERFFKAYFTEGRDLADSATLAELGGDIGLDRQEVLNALNDDHYAYLVNQDIMEARQIGVTGVPFFVFNRKYAVSGAQPADAFLKTMEKAFAEWRRDNPRTKLDISEGPSCTPEGLCE